MPVDIQIDESDLKMLNVDDSLEIVINKFPLKYVLKALLKKYGREALEKSLLELNLARPATR